MLLSRKLSFSLLQTTFKHSGAFLAPAVAARHQKSALFATSALLVSSFFLHFFFSAISPVQAGSCTEQLIDDDGNPTDACSTADNASQCEANETYSETECDPDQTYYDDSETDYDDSDSTNDAGDTSGGSTTPTDTNSADINSGVCYFPIAEGSLRSIRYTFGQARKYNGTPNARCHAGIDIMTTGNEEVVAAADGVVARVMKNFTTCTKTGQKVDLVMVSYGSQYLLYGELDPGSYSVGVGDTITAGQFLGTTHRCGMLHLEVRSSTSYYRWMPPNGQLVGSGANYCRDNYLSTKPDNLADPTSVVEGFSSGQCLTAPAGGSDSTAGGGTPSYIHAPVVPFVQNNRAAESVWSLDELTAHLIYDGNQAYCAAKTTIVSNFSRSKYQQMALNLSAATIPLMRNQKETPQRLNSAELYYGYTANAAVNKSDEFTTQSSALSKYVDEMSGCLTKVNHQVFLIRRYAKCALNDAIEVCAYDNGSKAEIAACMEKAKVYCDNIFKMGLTDEEIALINDDLSSKKVSSGTYVMAHNGYANGTLTAQGTINYCSNLLRSTDPKDKKIRELYQIMPLYSNNLYRTGYIVEAVKICPVNRTNGGHTGEKCGVPTYKYDNCTWQIVPDYVRTYPFKLPDFATNNNYCKLYISGQPYPQRCVRHDLLNIAVGNNYSPAELNAQFLQTLTQQEKFVDDSRFDRDIMAWWAQDTDFDNPKKLIYCPKCKTNMSKALVKIINATNENNKFNEAYLGEEAGDMSCKVDIKGEESKEIKTSAVHSQSSDHKTVYEKPVTTTVPNFPSRCCEKEERREIVYYINGVKRVRYEWYCAQYAYTKAQFRYWIVAPQGEELKKIEETILGSFYQSDKTKANSSTNTNNNSTSDSGSTTPANPSSIDYSTRSLEKATHDGMAYYIYKPQANVTGLPLITFLHGAGYGGTTAPGLTQLLAQGANFPAVIIAPQSGGNWRGSRVPKVKSIIDSVVEEYKLDSSKISITGHSMGARGVYHLVSAYPGFFSAAAPVSAVTAASDSMTDLNYSALAQTPFRSYTDRSKSGSEQNRIKKINESGGTASYTSVPEANHDTIPKFVYPSDKTDLIQWLIGQTNPHAPATTTTTTTTTTSGGASYGGNSTSGMGTYEAFVASDKRQNKYLKIQGITGGAASINMLGAGPITNIFIVQESLYPVTSGIYQTLLQYKNINDYFTDHLSGGANDGQCSWNNYAVRIRSCGSKSVIPERAYPGGYTIGAGGVYYAKELISMKDYVMGVIPPEIRRLCRSEQPFEGLKMFMILARSYAVRRSESMKKAGWIEADGVMQAPNSSYCYQQWRPLTYWDGKMHEDGTQQAPLRADELERLSRAYDEIGSLYIFESGTERLLGPAYYNTIANEIYDLAMGGATMEQIFSKIKSKFPNTYANAELKVCNNLAGGGAVSTATSGNDTTGNGSGIE